MPRTRRVVLPEYPHHVVQRGNNRQVVFAEPADCRRYLETIEEFKDEQILGRRVEHRLAGQPAGGTKGK